MSNFMEFHLNGCSPQPQSPASDSRLSLELFITLRPPQLLWLPPCPMLPVPPLFFTAVAVWGTSIPLKLPFKKAPSPESWGSAQVCPISMLRLSTINDLLEADMKAVQAACSIRNGQEESVDRLICRLEYEQDPSGSLRWGEWFSWEAKVPSCTQWPVEVTARGFAQGTIEPSQLGHAPWKIKTVIQD